MYKREQHVFKLQITSKKYYKVYKERVETEVKRKEMKNLLFILFSSVWKPETFTVPYRVHIYIRTYVEVAEQKSRVEVKSFCVVKLLLQFYLHLSILNLSGCIYLVPSYYTYIFHIFPFISILLILFGAVVTLIKFQKKKRRKKKLQLLPPPSILSYPYV